MDTEEQKMACPITDRINRLPDPLLHHIISLLPFKDAVRASAVAKGWRKLWTFVPNIDLSMSDFRRCGLPFSGCQTVSRCMDEFLDFVDRLLNSRTELLRINRLRLWYYSPRWPDRERVDNWIQSCKVEEFHLSIAETGLDYVELPSRLSQSVTLTVLELSFCNINRSGDLFSHGFPTLERLFLSNCMNPDLLTINCPMLKKLVIFDDPRLSTFEVLHVTAKELEELEISGIRASSLYVSAPCLRYFTWFHDCQVDDIVLQNLISLELAKAWVDTKFVRAESTAVQLLHGLSHTRRLNLRHGGCVTALTSLQDLHGILPTFVNMNHLRVTTKLCEENNYVLAHLLHKCPTLQGLHIDRVPYNYGEALIFEREYPECSFYNLKNVTIRDSGSVGDDANDDTSAFVVFLLKSAVRLEIFDTTSTSETISKIKNKLLTFPVASPSAEIILKCT